QERTFAGVPLPCVCSSPTATAYADNEIEVIGDTSDSDSDSDSGSTITINGTSYRDAYFQIGAALDRPTGSGNVLTGVHAQIPSGTTYGVSAAAVWNSESHAYYTGATTSIFETGAAQAFGTYTIDENPTYPTEGYETGSAVLSGYFYVIVDS